MRRILSTLFLSFLYILLLGHTFVPHTHHTHDAHHQHEHSDNLIDKLLDHHEHSSDFGDDLVDLFYISDNSNQSPTHFVTNVLVPELTFTPWLTETWTTPVLFTRSVSTKHKIPLQPRTTHVHTLRGPPTFS